MFELQRTRVTAAAARNCGRAKRHVGRGLQVKFNAPAIIAQLLLPLDAAYTHVDVSDIYRIATMGTPPNIQPETVQPGAVNI
jgi:hypothetical protein